MGWVLLLLHGAQVALSLNAGYHSYTAITNLQQYESVTQKAAKYSGVADAQLQRTRKTQAAGAVTLVASFASAIYLAVNSLTPSWWQMTISIVNAAATTGSRAYMMDFWSKKRTVPVVEAYNQGIEHSNRVNDFLQYLTVAWILSSVVTLGG